MAEGLVLPYLDIPFQHASPKVLKAMKRPANEAKVLERIRGWREICPDIAIRSTFIVGFPGETEEDFDYLLDWLDEAQLDRVGAFRFEPVSGAAANALPGIVPEEVKEERYARFMEKTAAISAAKLAGQDRPHARRDHRRGRRGRRRHRPLQGRRARDRRRGPSARRRPSAAGRHRAGARSRMPTSTTCSAFPSSDRVVRGQAASCSTEAVSRGTRRAVVGSSTVRPTPPPRKPISATVPAPPSPNLWSSAAQAAIPPSAQHAPDDRRPRNRLRPDGLVSRAPGIGLRLAGLVSRLPRYGLRLPGLVSQQPGIGLGLQPRLPGHHGLGRGLPKRQGELKTEVSRAQTVAPQPAKAARIQYSIIASLPVRSLNGPAFVALPGAAAPRRGAASLPDHLRPRPKATTLLITERLKLPLRRAIVVTAYMSTAPRTPCRRSSR